MSSGSEGRLQDMETKNLATLYDLDPLDWSRVTGVLDAGFTQAPGTGGPDRHTCWLATIDPDGRPHVTAVGALWLDGTFWFVTGATSRKGRNVGRDPRCSLSVALRDLDLVVEGEASLVTDPEVVARRVADYAADGWGCSVDESGTAFTAPYSAPSAGPPPWSLYRLDITKATALATAEPGGATQWTF